MEGLVPFAYFIAGVFVSFFGMLICDLYDLLHHAYPLIKSFINERKAKKSGKLTTDQRLELLESKIDSIADIVISSSEEVK